MCFWYRSDLGVLDRVPHRIIYEHLINLFNVSLLSDIQNFKWKVNTLIMKIKY